MQKDVILFMGSHQTGGTVEDDQLQLITTGQYYHKNGKHYVPRMGIREISQQGCRR